jgi:hypothetical protein
VLLAACGEGVFVEVDATAVPGVERVEIVVAGKTCEHPFEPGVECDHMQGEGFPFAFRGKGNIFSHLAAATTAVDGDGLATFQLEPGLGRVPMAFAIGRDATGAALGVAMMEDTLEADGGTVVFRVRLDPTSDLFENVSEEHAGIREWGGPTNGRCIGVRPRLPDPERDPAFIVPQDNPDCDAQKTFDEECDPLWFDGFLFDEASDRHCVVRSERVPPVGPATEPPCVLGHFPTCDENPSIEKPCREQPGTSLCLPSALCGPTPCTDTCLDDLLLSGLLEPRLVCRAPGRIDINRIVPCAQSTMTIVAPTNLSKCSDAQLTGSDPPFHATRSLEMTDGDARFRIVDRLPTCEVQLVWEGSSEGPKRTHTTIVFTVQDEDRTRELMVPLAFELIDDCSQAETICQLVQPGQLGMLADTAMASCAAF